MFGQLSTICCILSVIMQASLWSIHAFKNKNVLCPSRVSTVGRQFSLGLAATGSPSRCRLGIGSSSLQAFGPNVNVKVKGSVSLAPRSVRASWASTGTIGAQKTVLWAKATKSDASADAEGAAAVENLMPAKVATAYILFSVEKRAEIKASNPKATFGELSKLVSKMWKDLSEVEKAPYNKLHDERKAEALAAFVNRPSMSSQPTTVSLNSKPIILLDVDGVLNMIFRSDLGWPMDSLKHFIANGFGIVYSEEVAAAVNKWSKTSTNDSAMADVRWLTTWDSDAQSKIAPGMGLVAKFPVGRKFKAVKSHPHDNIEEKSVAVRCCLEANPNAPLVWVDDEITELMQVTVLVTKDTRDFILAEAKKRPFLAVQPERGLTPNNVAQIEGFLLNPTVNDSLQKLVDKCE